MKKPARFLTGLLALGSTALMAQTSFLSEDFESGAPAGWTQITNASDGGWLHGDAGSLSSQSWPIDEHTDMMATNDDACDCDKSSDRYITPSLDLSTASTVFLSVDVFFGGLTYQGNTEEGYIEVSTDGGNTFTAVETLEGNPEWETILVDLSAYAGMDDVMISFHYNDGNGWLFGYAIDNVEVYEPVSFDLTVNEFSLSDELSGFVPVAEGAQTISGVVTNLGADAVTSFTINYTVDGGSAVSATMDGVNIAPLSTYAFSHSSTWTPLGTGSYEVNVYGSAINGNDDQNTDNDDLTRTIVVVDDIAVRRPLIEDFGSSTCPPCATLAITFDPLLLDNGANMIGGDISAIKYQMNWPAPGNDPSYNPDGVTRQNYYGVNAIPSSWADGEEMESENQDGIDEVASVPSFMEIDVSFTIENEADVNVTVTVHPLADYPSNNLRLHIAAVEDYYEFNGGTTSQDDYYQVMRKMLPDGDGTNLDPLTGGTSVTVEESYSFSIGNPQQGNYELWQQPWGHLNIVAWVQDNFTKEIFQTGIAQFHTGVEAFDALASDFKVFPNPFRDFAFVNINLKKSERLQLEVFNIIGERVWSEDYGTLPAGRQQLEIDGASWENGLYFFQVTVGNTAVTKKVNLNR